MMGRPCAECPSTIRRTIGGAGSPAMAAGRPAITKSGPKSKQATTVREPFIRVPTVMKLLNYG